MWRSNHYWKMIHCFASSELASDLVGNVDENNGEVSVLAWCFLELERFKEEDRFNQ